ncbi:MAG TPA: substrate-binding domain-containing protein [Burkholderiales bacterium]|nr:substrate-binding domain-containing protein [Burkholderiales bacterium]
MWCNLTGGLAVLLSAGAAWSAQIVVFCPGAVRGVVTELAQAYQRDTHNGVKLEFGTAGALQKRAAAGEPADVVIVTSGGLSELIKQGKVDSSSTRNVGKVGVGVAVRAGAPKPDIATADAFKATMLHARSVMYADPALGGQSGMHVARVFERLGIAGEMKPKTVLRPGAPEGLAEVAKGDIEIGLGQVSEIVAAKGVTLVGPLPPVLQNTLTFAAGRTASSHQGEAAARFIAELVSPQARAKFAAAGFESAD